MPGGRVALRSLPRSRAPAAPTTGMGLGGPGKILLEWKGFSQGALARGPQGPAWVKGAARWGNGLGRPGDQGASGSGCCMLRGCCGLGDAVGHGGAAITAPRLPGRAR